MSRFSDDNIEKLLKVTRPAPMLTHEPEPEADKPAASGEPTPKTGKKAGANANPTEKAASAERRLYPSISPGSKLGVAAAEIAAKTPGAFAPSTSAVITRFLKSQDAKLAEMMRKFYG